MGSYSVSRSITINAPADHVHTLIADLRQWTRWSPWEGIDPALERTYSGAESGVGQRYAWSGNKKAGSGTMEVIEASLPRTRIAVNFIKPFKSSSMSILELTPRGDQTDVVWRMEARQNALMSLVGKVYPMDKMLGPDFEKGLAQLKTAAEHR